MIILLMFMLLSLVMIFDTERFWRIRHLLALDEVYPTKLSLKLLKICGVVLLLYTAFLMFELFKTDYLPYIID